MFLGSLFTIIHVIYMLTATIIVLFSNNVRILSYTLMILLMNYISILYFKDCIITILENKYGGCCTIHDISKYTHVYFKNTEEFSSTVACTIVTTGILATLIKLSFIIFYPKIMTMV
jgi:hypothetical protein